MTIHVLTGDCREVLPTLAAESVQCVVTSPPYFNLRDYHTASWEGGDAGCDHLEPLGGGFKASGLANYANGLNDATIADKIVQRRQQYRDLCHKCGARRFDRQIGREATPAEYVAALVEVFREVKRVLRPDGLVFLNVGDSYSSGTRKTQCKPSSFTRRIGIDDGMLRAPPIPGIKPKDLIGIPWRVAFGLQDDGWWLRSDIVWAKLNPMPESVRDRPTRAHEYVFMLSKSDRYYYDADAIAESAVGGNPHDLTGGRYAPPGFAPHTGTRKNLHGPTYSRHRSAIPGGQSLQAEPTATRNARSVWTIATQPYAEAHFATMPPALAERCIKAGSRPGDTVLDPFSGAGTTLLVADRLQRHGIGIDLSPSYGTLAKDRIAGDAPLLVEIRCA